MACGRALRRIIAITFGEWLGFSDEPSIGIARCCDGLFGLPLRPVHCSVNKRGMQSFEIAPDTLSSNAPILTAGADVDQAVLQPRARGGLIRRLWPLVFATCGPRPCSPTCAELGYWQAPLSHSMSWGEELRAPWRRLPMSRCEELGASWRTLQMSRCELRRSAVMVTVMPRRLSGCDRESEGERCSCT